MALAVTEVAAVHDRGLVGPTVVARRQDLHSHTTTAQDTVGHGTPSGKLSTLFWNRYLLISTLTGHAPMAKQLRLDQVPGYSSKR